MQSRRSVIKREAWAAGTMIVLGLGAIAQATTYTLGSLARMGPGLFPAILGVLLVLRQRSHVDPCRRVWLFIAGIAALLSAFAVAVAAAPALAHWLCVAAAVGCAACSWCFSRPIELSPLLRNAIQVVEYAALVSVIPLAFWVAGLYGLVREASLS